MSGLNPTITLDQFTRAYIECALWASTDESEDPLDANYTVDDLSPDALTKMRDDCMDFQQAQSELLSQWYSDCGEDPERSGHDFWLTRNRHGAGFWDRWFGDSPQAKLGNLLSDAAHVYGSCDLYVGDDGKVEVM